MAYGEKLAHLNPCGPKVIAELLASLINPGGRLADIGCGRGATLCWLAEHCSYELYGAEPDETLYACAVGDCPSAAIVMAESDDLPYGNDFFHAAIMECVFSLTNNPSAAAGEAARAIRKHGFLILTDLFTNAGEDIRLDQALLRRIYASQSIDGYFIERGFLLYRFIDCTRDLRSMFAQMLMDGSADIHLDDGTRKRLRQVKAGYGIWIFQKA